jgi:hypothetical protein
VRERWLPHWHAPSWQLVSGGSESYLVDKLLGTNLCSGSQMPKAGSSLPCAQLDAVRSWICEGAPNS